MKRILCFIVFVLLATSLQLSAQRKVTFLSSDGLEITADLYLHDRGAPYIILLHKENSSRGEYREIAPRLTKMGFNCLAIDLRSGKESNFVQNETAAFAQKNNFPTSLLDCENDILSAIEYIRNTAINPRCILFGSCFSASLAMKVANQNRRITAVIASSPGEYFKPLTVKDWLTDFNQLLFVTSTKWEEPFVNELLSDIPPHLISRYQSSEGGVQGAPALWNDNPETNVIWMSLMMFINKVRKEKYYL